MQIPKNRKGNLLLSVATLLLAVSSVLAQNPQALSVATRMTAENGLREPRSTEYSKVQERLARGWNTWDVHSVATQVLLPEGLAIHVGLKHNTTLNGDAFLADSFIGRLDTGAEIVTPGPHTWNGSYTRADFEWNGHMWLLETAHDGDDLVLVIAPLPSKVTTSIPPTVVVSVNYLWNRPGTVDFEGESMRARSGNATTEIHCTCEDHGGARFITVPIAGPYFAADLTGPVGISTGKRRSLDEIIGAIEKQRDAFKASVKAAGRNGPILSAVQTTIGWDTIYDPEKQRVLSPVSRVWSVGWGGYVLFDWDTFFAATLASIGDKDLAYANALEILREETPQGFVPNYARAGNWKSTDRSEPPVGSITVLDLYQRFHDRWFLEDAFTPLLSWNRWWNEHRQMEGFIVLGSDPDNQPANLDDRSRGTWQGAVYESGLDNSPMYDGTFYNPQTHLLEYADVGMTSLYIADCDGLAQIADTLQKPAEAKELRDRARRYRAKLATLWDEKTGIFLNRDLHTGQFNYRLSPTNFYPMLAKAATPEQARRMIEKHLLNPDEFWGQWVIPMIARNDPAFKDQAYWRGRIWGPANYLVYLGLENYADADTRRQFAAKSYNLFLKEWNEKRHVHENYNAITGEGDDVKSSDRFYHWGALLGYVESLESDHPQP
ncbi:MAG: trehalase family glycosidase [Terracidiphilus sp.]